MKRDARATPFKINGPTSTWTSSSDSPENPVGQLTHATQSSAQEVAEMSSMTRRGQRSSSSTAGGAAHGDGSSTAGQQIPTGLHLYNTQNIQQNMYQQQVNQVEPEQLEQLLESLVKARVENNYHQMRRAAQQEIEMIRQQAGSNQQAVHDHVQVRLQQLQQEKQLR